VYRSVQRYLQGVLGPVGLLSRVAAAGLFRPQNARLVAVSGLL
jgi:hypothetical protein